MKPTQSAYAAVHPIIGRLLVEIEKNYDSLPAAVRDAFDQIEDNPTFGCHVELQEGMTPDACVIMTGKYDNCRLAKQGMMPSDCEYWKPFTVADVPVPARLVAAQDGDTK
ncbi:MAG: hypothetical protein ACYC9L_14165 [Sulfuricaulis sp.]